MASRQTGSSSLTELVAALRAGEWIDLTPPIENGMPRWPTHPHVVIQPTTTHERDGYFNQTLVLGEHSGAHVDAPAHSHAGARTIDSFPPDFLIAPAKVITWDEREWQPGELASADDVLRWERESDCELAGGDVVLVDFGWHVKHWRTDAASQWYAENMPGMGEDIADLFLERGVRAVGSDTIACGSAVVDGRSLGPPPENCWLHRKLLRADVLLLENLANLERLPSECLFVALPLAIKGGSGSPVRAAAFVPA